MDGKCFNCGETFERALVTEDDVELCDACYREVPDEPFIDDPRRSQMMHERTVDLLVDRIADAFTCDEDNRPSRDDDEGGW